MKNAILRTFLICTAALLSLFITTQLSANEWKLDMISNHPAKWSRYTSLQRSISLENDRLKAMSKTARNGMQTGGVCGNTYELEETIYFISDFFSYYKYNCMLALSIMTLSFILLFEIVIFGSRSPIACFLNNGWIGAATLPRVGVSVAAIAFFAGFFMLNEKTVEAYDMDTTVIGMSKFNYNMDTTAIGMPNTYYDFKTRTHRTIIHPW